MFNNIFELNNAGFNNVSLILFETSSSFSYNTNSLIHIELFNGVLSSWDTEDINLDLCSLSSSSYYILEI